MCVNQAGMSFSCGDLRYSASDILIFSRGVTGADPPGYVPRQMSRCSFRVRRPIYYPRRLSFPRQWGVLRLSVASHCTSLRIVTSATSRPVIRSDRQRRRFRQPAPAWRGATAPRKITCPASAPGMPSRPGHGRIMQSGQESLGSWGKVGDSHRAGSLADPKLTSSRWAPGHGQGDAYRRQRVVHPSRRGPRLWLCRPGAGLAGAGRLDPTQPGDTPGCEPEGYPDLGGGDSYPGAERLRSLIAIYLERDVFEVGWEEAEAAALWASARGKAARRLVHFRPPHGSRRCEAGAVRAPPPRRPRRGWMRRFRQSLT